MKAPPGWSCRYDGHAGLAPRRIRHPAGSWNAKVAPIWSSETGKYSRCICPAKMLSRSRGCVPRPKALMVKCLDGS